MAWEECRIWPTFICLFRSEEDALLAGFCQFWVRIGEYITQSVLLEGVFALLELGSEFRNVLVIEYASCFQWHLSLEK